MPWTSWMYPTSVTDQNDAYPFDWTFASNLITGGTVSANPTPATPFTASNADTQTLWLRGFSGTIPGGGSNVTQMRFAVEVAETLSGNGSYTMDASCSESNPSEFKSTTVSAGSTFSWVTITATPASWKLTATAIDNMVSGNSAYYMDLYFSSIDTVGATASQAIIIRNAILMFQYGVSNEGFWLAG